jgi:predicted site-specific integrase-resolvase
VTNPLFLVYTTKEAAEKWGLAEVTVRQWINRGKFRINEARKSAGTWLVTHAGMVRIAGEPKKEVVINETR